MGFFLVSCYFFFVGLCGTLGVNLLYNKGPSANTLHVTLVITTVVCCYLVWAIVWLAQWKPLVVPILKVEVE